jgi:hypothetical protein
MRRLIALWVITAVIFTAGCATTASTQNQAIAVLEASRTLKFCDIPVPAGFKELPHQSYLYYSGGLRVGILKYTVNAKPDQVINFFKDNMPAGNWQLVNAVEFGQRILYFEKGGESCIITVTPKTWVTQVTLVIGPKSPQSGVLPKVIIKSNQGSVVGK